ncbi:carbohydrate ABC transporter permease [Lachnoclostridium phytofermentans]|uniref:Binding-protein-dependent transport systems inner membrane component n=1 Tax=Lachnoclostridium phytofermentans (strain ATCC 700394 / DSM 18823 / ISDg) TaxID=357809 RepID=A9KLI5_LACP7|nr:carbohydrate ABC transporter permease [Lachnoclostridium phytofermentans]ABX41314.1 binding-protein-dependent transport systems inner membrane component [Lachnoclostridium phytofermentans ISDg]
MTKKYNKYRTRINNKIFDIVVYAILLGVAIITIVPFLQVATISLSPAHVASSYGLHLFPKEIDLNGYKSILRYKTIWTSYGNTIMRTVLGTGISMILYVTGAYPLAKKYLPHRKFWTLFVIFTMYFSGGMIPMYLLINNWLKISNTIWALVLPGAMSAYNLIIVRNFFESIPDSLEESARIDGANDITILFKIIIPLSKPCLATVSLWCIVAHWNSWFDCMLYMKEESKYVLQYTLQRILIDGQVQDINLVDVVVNTDSMKMAALMVSIIPIIIVYPFIQKYFTSGVMIGAVKG